jgi:hypothetical protein
MSASTHIWKPGHNQGQSSFDAGWERHFWTIAAIFLTLFLCWSLVQDVRLKMWYDELYTLQVAQQGPAEIIRGDMAGMDTSPPLYPILVSLALRVIPNDALAVRLISTLGFVGMLAGILAFCRPRMPASHAFLAALLAATSCRFYATEGRCYGLLLGCTAGALLCWQHAEDDRRRFRYAACLAVLLMVMTALHYYSIFFLIPLGCGEIARRRKRGRFDFAVMTGMLAAVAVLGLHLPLVMKAEKYAEHFWSPASWYQLPEFYLKFALVPAAAVLVALLARRRTWQEDTTNGLRFDEWVTITSLALAPVVVVAVSRYTTHVFVYRYTLWSVVGIVIMAAGVIFLWSAARSKLSRGLVVALLAVLVVQEGFAYRETFGLRESEGLLRQLKEVPAGTEPIAVGYSHAFMELAYYAPPELRSRMVCPVSRELDIQHKGFVDLDFSHLSKLHSPTKLSIVELDEFLEANRHFILAAHPKDYLPQYLQSQGYQLTALNPGKSPSIYEVEAPGSH